ncbi:MAG: hypothetical protein F6K23_14530 [Okeania sp. SIO2C9]|uniref:hypothetical protein n=1 Tax=Okeania sp. SIO2C9 TaxID=2607791 RepID=UPI0013BFE73E|nr:hypothetical protein [Okeania sp. SIO2C9]NEQ74148.1 hypothetical protein [Okeania sp. SIO2C9]
MSEWGISALRKNIRFFFNSGSENFSINMDISLAMSDFWLWEMMNFLYLCFV